MKIVVIGSGFGGLAAAIRLCAQGHDVTVLEKLDKPGGRAYVFEQDGFIFDAGPTIITAPWLIHELFEIAGRRTEDFVDLVRIDPFYNVRFPDGSVFRYNGDRAAVIEQIRAWSARDVRGYERFAAQAEKIFETGMALIATPFLTLGSMARILPDLIRLRSDRSVARFVEGYVEDDRLRQLLSFHPLLIGGNPFHTTNIYALIHTLEQKWGVWFAMGGMGKLVRAFATLIEEQGGVLRLGAEVEEIEIDESSGRATGVRLASGERIPADVIVSNADVAFTYAKLIAPRHRRSYTDAKIDRMRFSMSLFVLYFGTDRTYPDVAHHEILMGPRYRELLEDIFTRKILADDFSLYLHRPTATDPSLAPAGGDAFYVLSPVPHLGGDTDWSVVAPRYRDAIVKHLEEHHLPELSKHIVTERMVDPRYFRDTLNSHLGSAFSLEPVLTQSAWMRPHNRSEDVPNLYFAGAGTHPGAGIPGVISSGKIAADLIGEASSTTRKHGAARWPESLNPLGTKV